MSFNPHAFTAQELSERSSDFVDVASALRMIGRGQIEATLALAYEQRTANLIAAFGQLVDEEGETFLGERIDGYALAKEITQRLDLNWEATK